jgi:hypothetical protein
VYTGVQRTNKDEAEASVVQVMYATEEDAWIEPRTVAPSALAARSSDHSARSHQRTRLDLINELA